MSKPPLTVDPLSDAQSWDLPYIADQHKQDDGRTNALNRPSGWRYEPPEAEPEILPPTAEEIEAIRQAAKEEGLAEGKAQGYEEGFAQGQSEGHAEGLQAGQEQGKQQAFEETKTALDEQLQQWQQLNQQLHNPLQMVEKQLEQELVQLAVQLARSVIGVEVKTNRDIIFAALSQGLKVLPVGLQQYQLHMHPDDIALIKQHFSQQEIEKHAWQLMEAPHLSPGGCDISTDSNAVDVTLERRSKDVLDKFLLEQGLAQIEVSDSGDDPSDT